MPPRTATTSSPKGLSTGEVTAHLGEVCGAEVSREAISNITDRVLEGMVDWQNRPLDQVYPVVFIDALVVKIRDGQVANRPIYVVVGVTIEGERDILRLWANRPAPVGGWAPRLLPAGAWGRDCSGWRSAARWRRGGAGTGRSAA